jgi:K+-transporting ATPase KdpF subunit
MASADVFGLIVSVGLAGYLVFALFRGERF